MQWIGRPAIIIIEFVIICRITVHRIRSEQTPRNEAVHDLHEIPFRSHVFRGTRGGAKERLEGRECGCALRRRGVKDTFDT